LLTFKIGPGNGRESQESGLRLNGTVGRQDRPFRKQSSERVGSDDPGTPEQWKEECFDLFVVAFGSRLVRDVSFPTTAPGALK
jgi:hypothetical protein